MTTGPLVTPVPRPRCVFGRPHVWILGFYHGGTFVTDHVKCAECGQVEYEGPYESEETD